MPAPPDSRHLTARGKEDAVARGNAFDRANSKAVKKVNAFQGEALSLKIENASTI